MHAYHTCEQTHTLDCFAELYSNKLEKLDNYILPNQLHLYTNLRPISAGKIHWNYSRNYSTKSIRPWCFDRGLFLSIFYGYINSNCRNYFSALRIN